MEFKKPVVVIFGAGATRGGMENEDVFPPPPTDNDFLHIANQLRVREKGTTFFVSSVLKSVRDLYQKTSGIGLEYYYRDIEIRKQIVDFAPPRHNPKNWARPIMDLKELIRRVFIHTTCKLHSNKSYKPRESKIHKAILDHLKPNDAIITFNYDLLIEQSLSEKFEWHPSDGYGIPIQMKKEALNFWKKRGGKKSRCPILKLHGSINWEEQGKRTKTIKLKDRPYKVGKDRARVAILAPGWRKPIHEKPYDYLWKKARNYIEKAKTIIVLGYSLPETDFLAKSFLIEAIESKKYPDKREKVCKLSQLYLVDLDKGVREKFTTLFNPAMDYKTHVFQYSSLKEFHDSLPIFEELPEPAPIQ